MRKAESRGGSSESSFSFVLWSVSVRLEQTDIFVTDEDEEDAVEVIDEFEFENCLLATSDAVRLRPDMIEPDEDLNMLLVVIRDVSNMFEV